MSRRTPSPSPRVVYVDTAGLWSLEAILDPGKFRDRRWREYFALLCDATCNPAQRLRCAVPDAKRWEGPIPRFYNGLLVHGLVEPGESLGTARLYAPPSTVAAQLREFRRHVHVNPRGLSEWYRLHTHPEVRGGWRRGVPDQDRTWAGVPEWLSDQLLGQHAQTLEAIRSQTRWPNSKIALLFSFVQRGHAYAAHAGRRRGAYLTHQWRWQVLAQPDRAAPDRHFGLAIGGLVLGAIEAGTLARDEMRICEFLAELRSRVRRDVGAQLPAVETVADAMELLRPLLPGALGARLSRRAELVLRVCATALVKCLRAADKPERSVAWIVAEAAVALSPLPGVPATITPVVRRWIDYPLALDLPVRTCAMDGAELQRGRCRVCELRERETSRV